MLRVLYASLAAAALIAAPAAANAAILVFQGALTGPNENPPNASPATGNTIVTIDTVLNTIEVTVSFTGLTAGNTASHIHCCTLAPLTGTAGVATITPTFTGFPTGTTSGSYDHTFDLTSAGAYNPAFVTANGGSLSASELALINGIQAGEAYLNIHSGNFPNGEIRAFLTPVPEPATWATLIVGFGLVGAMLRRRRRPALAI